MIRLHLTRPPEETNYNYNIFHILIKPEEQHDFQGIR